MLHIPGTTPKYAAVCASSYQLVIYSLSCMPVNHTSLTSCSKGLKELGSWACLIQSHRRQNALAISSVSGALSLYDEYAA